MATLTCNTQTIRNEVVNIICSIKNTPSDKLLRAKDFTELGYDILDVVEIILEVEKTFHLTVPDEVPVYSVDDFVNYILHSLSKESNT
jgi:acyl carrier protein